MKNNHSKLPPSSAARRVVCPASRSLEARYPRTDSEASEEGHLAHDYAAACLRMGAGFATNPPSVSQEMHDAVMQYVNAVHSVSTVNLHIEERISIANIHPDCWGTPDCWHFNGGDLDIWDYKHGFGYVEVFENWQLIEYSAGIINKLRMEGHDVGDLRINYHIVQPRCFVSNTSVRTWRTTIIDVEPYFEQLRRAEYSSYLAPDEYGVSEQCRYCSARAACPGLARVTHEYLDLTGSPSNDDIREQFIGQELKLLQDARMLLDARITGLEEEASARIRQGEAIAHFRIGHTRSRQAWHDDHERIKQTAQLFGVNIEKRDLITPKQAITAGLPAALVNAASIEVPGAARLERIDARKLLTKPST